MTAVEREALAFLSGGCGGGVCGPARLLATKTIVMPAPAGYACS